MHRALTRYFIRARNNEGQGARIKTAWHVTLFFFWLASWSVGCARADNTAFEFRERRPVLECISAKTMLGVHGCVAADSERRRVISRE